MYCTIILQYGIGRYFFRPSWEISKFRNSRGKKILCVGTHMRNSDRLETLCGADRRRRLIAYVNNHLRKLLVICTIWVKCWVTLIFFQSKSQKDKILPYANPFTWYTSTLNVKYKTSITYTRRTVNNIAMICFTSNINILYILRYVRLFC